MSRAPEIPVRIGRVGDDAQFQRNLRRSSASAERFSARMAANGRIIRGWSLAILAAGAGVGALARSALDAADSIDKASRAANIGAERLQTLRFAAEQSGISSGRMDTALAKFNVTIGKVASGMETSSSTVVKAFEAIGISVDDVTNSGLTTEQMFDLVTTRLADVQDGAEQAAIAAQLFGRSAGPDMRNLLANGVEGMEKLEQAARDAGDVIDQALVTRGVEIADKWAKIMNSMAVSARKFALSAATSIDNAFGFTDSGKATQISGELDDLRDRATDVRESIRESTRLINEASTGQTGMIPAVQHFPDQRLMNNVKQLAEINDQISQYRAQLVELGRAKAERDAKIAALQQPPPEIKPGQLPGTGGGDDGGGGGSGGGGGGSGDAAARAEYDRLAQQWQSKLELLQDFQQQEQDVLAAAREKNIIDEETYQQQLLALDQKYAEARTKVARTEAAARINTVLGAGSDILSALGAFNEKALRVAKVFGAAQALVSTFQGQAEALKGPFPGNLAAAALIGAKGLGLVAAIKSVSSSGGGGAVGGAGGGGGAASAVAATPAPLQVQLSGINPGDLYSGRTFIDLFERLQKEAGDRGLSFGVAT